MELKNGKLVKATAEEVEGIKAIYYSSTCLSNASKTVAEKYGLFEKTRFYVEATNIASNIINACLYCPKYLKIV